MKAFRSFWVLTLTLLLTASGAGQEKKAPAPGAPQKEAAIAVLDFAGPPMDKDFRGDLLADLITIELANQFSVVDRKEMAKILAEQALNRSGIVNPAEAVRIGKMVGAKYLLAGRVFRVGNNTNVTARLISVETGRLRGLNLNLPAKTSVNEISSGAAQQLLKQLPTLMADLSKPVPPATPDSVPGPATSRRSEDGREPSPEVGRMPSRATLAVMNFDNLNQGDVKWDWLSKGLADLTIADLSSQDLRVASREQMQEMVNELYLRNKNIDPKEVARVLKVVRWVHGTFREKAGQVELSAAVVSADSGQELHSARVAGPSAEVLTLQKKLSADLADFFKGNKPGTLDPARMPRWTESLSACQLLYQGVDLFDKGQYLDAWGLFRRALRVDPSYADARYWAGRMMYFVLEYEQARLDLESFATAFPKHPRVGDAVMEIISAAQLTSPHPDEVLHALYFAAELAPKAEVHNQFGALQSSTVGMYAAGLAAQVLRPQKRYREAFEFYRRYFVDMPRDSIFYWRIWCELFGLRIQHLKATAEVLEMPPAPELTWTRQLLERTGRPPDLVEKELYDWEHKSPYQRYLVIVGGAYASALTVDDPVWQDVFQMTPQNPTVELNFGSMPFKPHYWYQASTNRPPLITRYWAHTYIRHYYADPQHELASIDLEIRYRHDPDIPFEVRVEGDVTTPYYPLNASGVIKDTIAVPFGTRAVSCRLVFKMKLGKTFSDATAAEVTSWKMTGRFRPRPTKTGSLILGSTDDLSFKVLLDGQEVPIVHGTRQIDNVPEGKHTLHYQPVVWGTNAEKESSFELKEGEALAATLSAKVDPRRRSEEPWISRTISTDYPAWRLGLGLGDIAGQNANDLRVCVDRYGRWIAVWHMRRDLYMAISSDKGMTWSPPQPLPTPVNSAHSERFPVLIQDSDGRYVLMFSSDRGLNRAHSIYVCWSEDLINFSAPVLLLAEPNIPYRVLRRSDGMYLAYMLTPFRGGYAVRDGKAKPPDPYACLVCGSFDLQHWSRPREVWSGMNLNIAVEILEDQGRFLLLGYGRNGLRSQTSLDGVVFSSPEPVQFRGMPYHMVGRSDQHGPYVVMGAPGGQCSVLRYEGGVWKSILAAPRPTPVSNSQHLPHWGSYVLDENRLCFIGLPYKTESYDAKAVWIYDYSLNEKPPYWSHFTAEARARDPRAQAALKAAGQAAPTDLTARFEKAALAPEIWMPAVPLPPGLSPRGQSRLSPLPVVQEAPVLPGSDAAQRVPYGQLAPEGTLNSSPSPRSDRVDGPVPRRLPSQRQPVEKQ